MRRSLPPALLALALGGCTTISAGRYTTGEPLGKDVQQFTVGMQIPKDGGHGLDRTEAEGDPVAKHHGGALINNVDVNWHVGLTERLEASVQAYLWGGKVGGRYTWLDGQRFKSSIGGYVGGSWGLYHLDRPNAAPSGETLRTSGTVGVDYYDLPITFSAHFGDEVAVFAGWAFTRFNAVGSLKDEDLGNNQIIGETYQRRVHVWEHGPFVGASFGDEIRVTPGIQFYREPAEHPVRNAGGIGQESGKVGTFAYPFLGLTYIHKPKRLTRKPPRIPVPEQFPTPAPEPVPSPEAAPSPEPAPTPEPEPAASPQPTPELSPMPSERFPRQQPPD